ncbi:unnamed protein product [Parnassius apollo]|uniref:(apollo) hypothetical protein n=1 Tax=Parnassius apollo TaxID=110799 RepID=A0A8S3WL73_PARAO|nr:unnamed protein product [Parnassius apollo]
MAPKKNYTPHQMCLAMEAVRKGDSYSAAAEKYGVPRMTLRNKNEKENLTVLLTANAAEQLAPPMIVFSYERIPRAIARSIPENWGIGRSENGWKCGSTFYEYVTNTLYPWLVQNITVSESNTKAVTNKKDDRPGVEQNTTRMITVSEQTTSSEIVPLICPLECHDDNSTTSARSSAETLQNKDVFGPTNNIDQNELIPSSSTASFAHDMLNKGILEPSPFKKALFWPEPTQKKRKISKEKIPSAIRSKSWREFYAKKDAERKEKEDIKAKRKQLRKEKKELKEKAIIEKQKNTSRRKENMKKRRHVSITSSESDVVSGVTYAETGGSEM